MKEPIEKILEQMALAKPSPDLDSRVEELIASSRSRINTQLIPKPPIRKPVASWVVVGSTAIACLLSGILIGKMWNGGTNRDVISNAGVSQLDNDSADTNSSRFSPTEWTIVDSATKCIDQGIVVLDKNQVGKKYMMVTRKRFRIRDEQTGKTVELEIPVTRTIVAPAAGA